MLHPTRVNLSPGKNGQGVIDEFAIHKASIPSSSLVFQRRKVEPNGDVVPREANGSKEALWAVNKPKKKK